MKPVSTDEQPQAIKRLKYCSTDIILAKNITFYISTNRKLNELLINFITFLTTAIDVIIDLSVSGP